MKILFTLSILALVTISCTWENVDHLSDKFCDTTNVSYTDDIVPILANSCFECHNAIDADTEGSGLNLELYENVSLYAEIIVHAINHDEDYPAMPKDKPQLDSCQIKTIEAWVIQQKPSN